MEERAGKPALSETSAALGAGVDIDLAAIQSATASLPDAIRAAILALVAAVLMDIPYLSSRA
jgi:hypothetical protein